MRLLFITALALLLACGVSQGRDADAKAEDETVVQVFDHETIHWDKEQPALTDADGFVLRHVGHTVDRTLDLPTAPSTHSDDRRIVAIVDVKPIHSTVDGRQKPNDPWNRLGSVSVVGPSVTGGERVETELIRFVTGYGGPGTFEQDVTALAPLLYGRTTLRAFLSSYSEEPGWMISVRLRYTREGVGQRRPALAKRVFNEPRVSSASPTVAADIVIPPNLDTPRLRIISTGHATDGQTANEFVTSSHLLRIDGRVVAKWRPWADGGGVLRSLNPRAGKWVVEGREVRASDLDRSGWNPGLVVEPLVIPLPELTPGPHKIELKISNIRRPGPLTETGKRHHGYWVVSATLVADEPWPEVADE